MTTISKAQLTLWVETRQGKSPSCQFGDHKHCGSEDIMVLVCRVVSENYVLKRSWALWMGAPMLSHHHANFSGHRDCTIRDVL